eukprot:GHVS01083819.1.p1 GENE.GHVS01083819.1~~GHVS01083819.1.p1  ORF type:complete len:370 (+),score=36.72 GHVS01083819.1:92-1111(+)
MLLIFSLQPNDINATTTVQSTADYLKISAEVKGVLKQYAEVFGVFNAVHVLPKTDLCHVDGAVVRLNALVAANVDADDSARPSFDTPFSWTKNNNNYIVKIKLINGDLKHDVTIDLGPLDYETTTLSSLRDYYYNEAFPAKYDNSNNIINCASYIGGDTVDLDTDPQDVGENWISPLSLSNGWLIETPELMGVCVDKDNDTWKQSRMIRSIVKSEVGGDKLGEAYVKFYGPEWRVEPASEYEKGLFVELQEQLETAIRLKWNDDAIRLTKEQPFVKMNLSGSVETVFNHFDTNKRFTVTTEAEVIVKDDVLKYDLTSSVGEKVDFKHTIYAVDNSPARP